MRRVRLWFTGEETALARRYSRIPKARNPGPADLIWIPKSQIEHTTKYPAVGGDWPEHHMQIAEWFADKNNL